jgi:hypothetical protein
MFINIQDLDPLTRNIRRSPASPRRGCGRILHSTVNCVVTVCVAAYSP